MIAKIAGCRKFSLHLDSRTDAGVVEDELFFIQYLNTNCSDRTMRAKDQFLCVKQLSSGTALDLYDCLIGRFDGLGVTG